MKKIGILILNFVLMFGGICVIKAEDYEAIIGSTNYTTLSEAITNSKNNEEIKILKDINDKIEIASDKQIIIDLNNKTITNEILNNGTLTLKNGTLDYATKSVINKEGANLVIDNVIIKNNDEEIATYYVVRNEGNLLLKNSQFIGSGNQEALLGNFDNGEVIFESGNYKGDEIFYRNTGEIIIDGGTFELTGSSATYNSGTIIINSGVFKSVGTIFNNNNGGATIEINDGEFYGAISNSYFSRYDELKSVININGGTFNSSDQILSNSIASKNVEININGGEFNTSTVDGTVIGNYCDDNCYININGGVINASSSKGIYGENGITIGKNDGNVTNKAPLIYINSGTIYGLLDEDNYLMNFYDGKIVLNKKIERNINVPEGYYVQYDLNDDNTYTAYLKKITDESGNSTNNDIKNPSTGISLGYGILVLISLVSGIAYMLIRKQSKFIKHN